MTFTIAPGHYWKYLIDRVGKGKENYYLDATDRGEPPGIWQGRGAAALGLAGQVEDLAMEAVYGHFVDPRDPAFTDRSGWVDAAKLGRPPRQYATPAEILVRKLAAEPGVTGRQLTRLRLQTAFESRGTDATTEQTAMLLAAKLAAEPSMLPERVEQLRAQARKEARHAVAFLDLTFSVPKSVTILHTALRAQELAAQRAGNQEAAAVWGRRARLVEDAIWAGNNAGLEYWQQHAGYSRAGYHGRKDPHGATVGRYVDGHDWVIASFYQHTSRSGDPQLHIHNPVLNRVQNPDGSWRTLDSRAVHRVRPGAAAIAERSMFEQLVRTLGVDVRMRPDGRSMEIATVPAAARELFSTRRQAVTKHLARLVRTFEARYGQQPNALQLSRLAQQATLHSRPGKSHQPKTLARELDEWSARLRAELDTTMADIAARSVGRIADVGAAAQVFEPDVVIAQALHQVQAAKAVWTRHDLLRAVNDNLPDMLGGLPAGHVRNLLDELTDRAVRPDADRVDTDTEVVRLSAPDLVPAPDEVRRADGRSQFEPPAADLYATLGHLRAEERLIHAAERIHAAPRLSPPRAQQVIVAAGLLGRPLGADQAAAVHGVLTSGRRLEALIGLAGAGKSYTVGVIAQAWEEELGGRVFGLATSQQAAQVLQDEGVPIAENIRMWLDRQAWLDGGDGSVIERERQRRRWRLRPGDLIVLDEAGMTPTADVDAIRARVEMAGAKLLAVGDDRQLPAVGAGGALRLISQHGRTYRLAQVHRMQAGWERAASVRLRDGDPAVLPVYERHGRIVDGGNLDRAGELAGRAWLASTISGERALLIVGTNAHATDLSERLRARLVDLGQVQEAGERIGLANDLDNTRTVAGIGDVIQTRRNHWGLLAEDGHPVLNRDLYKVVARPGGGALQVRRIDLDNQGREQLGPPIVLPADYLQRHATLGYAVTVHAAQGATVPAAYTVITSSTGADALYTALTRGRRTNIAFVETIKVDDTPPEVHIHDQATLQAGREPANPTQVLAGILERYQPDRPATEIERDALLHAGSLTKLGAEWTYAVDRINHDRYTAVADQLTANRVLTSTQRDLLSHDEAAGSMWRLVRAAELAGHDPLKVLSDAISARALDDAGSIAKVLHYRLTKTLNGPPVPTGDSYTSRTPYAGTDIGRWARDLATAMDNRALALGEQSAAAPPPWATARLGPVPDDPLARQDWITRAGRVAAYREQHPDLHPTDSDAIGPCPPPGATEARAAWYAAWRALGQPDDRRPEPNMTAPQLRDRIAAYAREEAWAPPWVGDQLRDTSHAARHYREHGVLIAAAANSATEPDRRADLAADAATYTTIADQLERSRLHLEHVDQARGRWYLHTADTRAAADGAEAELQRRQRNKTTTPTRSTAPTPATQPPQPAQPENLQQAGSQPTSHGQSTPPQPARPVTPQQGGAQHAPQTEPTSGHQPRPARTPSDVEPVHAQWPAGIPAPEQLADALQRANEAVRIMATRDRAATEQREATQRQHQLRTDRQRAAEPDRP